MDTLRYMDDHIMPVSKWECADDDISVRKLGKIFTGLTYKLPLSFMVISDVVYRYFIPNQTTLTKYCLTQ